MTTWSIALVLVVGCHAGGDAVASSSPTPSPSPAPIPKTPQAHTIAAADPVQMRVSDGIAALTNFKDAACNCVDQPCIDNVVAVIVQWDKQNRTLLQQQVPTEIEKKQLENITSDLSRCTKQQWHSVGSPPQ